MSEPYDPIVIQALRFFREGKGIKRSPHEPEEVLAWCLAKAWVNGLKAAKAMTERECIPTIKDCWEAFLPQAAELLSALRDLDDHHSM